MIIKIRANIPKGLITMANLSSFSLINAKVSSIYDGESLENKGTAFMYFFMRMFFKLNDSELSEAITDGSDDGEIDAIYIDDNQVNILTFKYTDNFEYSKRNYPGSEIDQFAGTVNRFISGELTRGTINEAVWEKYIEVKELSKTKSINFCLYVVSNKEQPTKKPKKILEDVVDKFRTAKAFYFDQDEIVNRLIEKKRAVLDGSLTFINNQHFEKSDGALKTVVGVIAADELIKLIIDDNEKLNENAFNENVRVYKPNHRVNKSIIDSAMQEDNYQFFYLNNGITILCNRIDYPPHRRNPVVRLHDFQIINGGQTSHSLYEVYKKNIDKINTIEILVRICEADANLVISDKISETTNNQIPVQNRDLHANDMIQRKLEEEFRTLGYFYERKPNQHSNEPKNKVINNELLGQLALSYYYDKPSEAKNNKNLVFNDYYDIIFDENMVNADRLLFVYELYEPLLKQKYSIQSRKRKGEQVSGEDSYISRGTFNILNGMKILFDEAENRVDRMGIDKLAKEDFKNHIYANKRDLFRREVIKYIGEIVENEKRIKGDDYTHDSFFKGSSTSKKIYDYVQEKAKEKDDIFFTDIKE